MRPDKKKWNFARRALLISGTGMLGISLLFPCFSKADNWQANIYEDSAPGRLVGVDKKRHTFNFFEKKQPVTLRYTYPCVTGQLAGDKQHLNDRRTPEGVYFVEYKIANGLDFREYGGIAYTLNYPNPVDRLRGKTGYGIWIHSKGFELVPTKGCVAINLKNIEEIGPRLLPGTPVVVAEELQSISGTDDSDLAQLKQLMEDWSKAWEGRSDKLFDFYDPVAYSRATENFTSFRQNKERLFKMLSFIKIFNREIHALAGPGYWVTWSEQLYKASNLSTEGVRRLYWQKDGKGQFRIVGMEWTPRDLGMQAEFSSGKLVAQAPTSTVTDAVNTEIPKAPRLDMPESPVIEERPIPSLSRVRDKGEASATQPWLGRVGEDISASLAALAKNFLPVSEPLVPKRLPRLQTPSEIDWGKGASLNDKTKEAASKPDSAQPEQVKAPVNTTREKQKAETPAANINQNLPQSEQPKTVEKTDQPQPVKVVQEPLALNDKTRKALESAVENWTEALARRDESILSLYDQKHYNRLIKEGVPRGLTFARVRQGMQDDFRQGWLEVLKRKPELEVIGNFARSRSDIMVVSPAGIRQGVQTLWWQPEDDGKFSIVSSEFIPRPVGLNANYLEKVSGNVSNVLEAWRKSWEGGDLEKYLSHYTHDANQQGRMGLTQIRRQKEKLWKNVKPVEVQFSGLRIALDRNGVRADMNQNYRDSAGKADRGLKTLLLRYDGDNWRIYREDWINLPQHVSR